MTTELEIGERVWRRLVSAGGFVWSHEDGSKTIHFNRGYKPTRELAEVVGRHRSELRAYVDAMHSWDESPSNVTPPPVKVLSRRKTLSVAPRRSRKFTD